MAMTPTSRGLADIAKVSVSGKIAGHMRWEFTSGSTTDTLVWKDTANGSTLLTLVVTYTDNTKATPSHGDYTDPAT